VNVPQGDVPQRKATNSMCHSAWPAEAVHAPRSLPGHARNRQAAARSVPGACEPRQSLFADIDSPSEAPQASSHSPGQGEPGSCGYIRNCNQLAKPFSPLVSRGIARSGEADTNSLTSCHRPGSTWRSSAGNRCTTTPRARLIKFSLPALPWLRSIQSGLSGFNSSDERLGSAGDSARRSLAWFWRSAGLNASETMRV
jgi:hypothetical protein